MALKIVKVKRQDIPSLLKSLRDIIMNLDEAIYTNKIKVAMVKDYTKAKLTSFTQNTKSLCFIAKTHDAPIGCILGKSYQGVFSIYFIGLRTFYRRKNVGSLLLATLTKESKKMKCHKLTKNVFLADKGGIKFFLKNKFKQEGLRKQHYFNENQVALYRLQ